MSNEILPFSHLTDEELLKRVYLSTLSTPLVLELAARLQHALDELYKKRITLEDVLGKNDKEVPDGNEA